MHLNFLETYKPYIVGICIFVFFLLITTTLLIPHLEADEVIYQTLGKRIAHLQSYSLQDTPVLKHLSQKMYNTPVFFRPPAFMVYLAMLYKILGTAGLYLAPVLVYILLCFVIYKSVQIITKSEHLALKSLLLSVFSTQLLFAATKIHLDLFLTLMITVSFLFLLLYRGKGQLITSLLSGLFLVFGVLSKYTAVIFYPFFFTLLAIIPGRKKLFGMLLFLIPGILLVIWFYYIFFIAQLGFDALVSAPDKEMLERSSFVRYVHNRQFYFYFINIFLINPSYLLLFMLLKRDIWIDLKRRYGGVFFLLLGIILAVIFSMTYFGIRGVSYQMRYILPAEPFLIMLLALIPFEKRESLRYFFCGALIYNLLLILYNFGKAEIFSFIEMALR